MSTDQPENSQENSSQMNLDLYDPQTPEILKKPVQAIHMAITGGVQNKIQRLAFNAMLKNAHEFQQRNPNVSVDTYEISRKELMYLIGYTSPNRKHLKATLSKMMDFKVEWDILQQDENSQWASCVLMPYVSFDDNKIYYGYAPQVKKLLFDPQTYSRLDLRIQRKFKLDSSAALYEWVNRFRHNPSKLTNQMEWETWRWVIYGAVPENSLLREYKTFKRNKLNPAIKEINAISDLTIQLIENKDGGRSVKFLQFEVVEKPMFQIAPNDETAQEEWNKKLEEFGVSVRDRKKILATYTIADIDAHYRYTVKRIAEVAGVPGKAIKNAAAYLKNALANQYAAEQTRQPVVEKGGESSALDEIQAAFNRHRNDEAEAMFKEMVDDEREKLLAQYNAMQSSVHARVPAEPAKRTRRFMAPFFIWLASETWGAPTPQELFEFAFKNNLVTLPTK